jgi:hypothetical protein
MGEDQSLALGAVEADAEQGVAALVTAQAEDDIERRVDGDRVESVVGERIA